MDKLKHSLRKNAELFFWVTAVVLLYFMNAESNGISFCLFKSIGFSWCPGCGIGHAIHAAMHLQFASSMQYHPLGIVAALLILYRIIQLSASFKKFST